MYINEYVLQIMMTTKLTAKEIEALPDFDDSDKAEYWDELNKDYEPINAWNGEHLR